MSNETYSALQKIYKIFKGISFEECFDCENKCCHSPWFLKEEFEANKQLSKENSNQIISFLGSSNGCKFFKNDRCQIYDKRPLDCRLFPLDLVEEDGEYWWAIFKNCSKYEEISKKLIPLIPEIEALFDQDIFKQYQRQMAITIETYEPYRLRQYKKIAKYKKTNDVL